MASELFLTGSERDRMLAFPEEISRDDLAHFFLLTDDDHRVVRRQRGAASRLGFALTLCAVRYLGFAPQVHSAPKLAVEFVASQLGCASIVDGYAARAMTRSAHTRRVFDYLGFRRVGDEDLINLETWLAKRAESHHRPSVLLQLACRRLYDLRLVRPGPTRLERLVIRARQVAEVQTYDALGSIIRRSRRMLDQLLEVEDDIGGTRLTWLRERERRNSSPAICRMLDRHQWLLDHEVATWNLEGAVHRNRRKYLARLGRSAPVQMLQRMPERRRYPVLVASLEQLLLDVTDDLVDMLERQLLVFWAKAEEAKQKFERERTATRDEIVTTFAKVARILLDSRVAPEDVRARIYARVQRSKLHQLTTAVGKDARVLDPNGLDFITDSYRSLRLFAARFLEQLPMHGDPDLSPEPPLMSAIRALQVANHNHQRTLPGDITTDFVSKSWLRYVAKGTGARRHIDRKHYELATFSNLGAALRSGVVWVENSRRFASPGSYLGSQ